jgi:5-methylcytosine-specific restriction endonuclease McrA
VSRQRGGSNQPDNLVTLCTSCHRLWHERGGGIVVEMAADASLKIPADVEAKVSAAAPTIKRDSEP